MDFVTDVVNSSNPGAQNGTDLYLTSSLINFYSEMSSQLMTIPSALL